MSIHTSLCTTSAGVALRRSSSSTKEATEVSGEGVRKSGQCFSRHIAASSAERSVPGRTRRARAAQGACTVSGPWWSSTAKLATVSHSGLGAMRTLVRSSVERGIVIIGRATFQLQRSQQVITLSWTATGIPTPFDKTRIDSVSGLTPLRFWEEEGEQTMVEHDEAGSAGPWHRHAAPGAGSHPRRRAGATLLPGGHDRA